MNAKKVLNLISEAINESSEYYAVSSSGKKVKLPAPASGADMFFKGTGFVGWATPLLNFIKENDLGGKNIKYVSVIQDGTEYKLVRKGNIRVSGVPITSFIVG